jgi:uncharacterized protein (DUF362 family)
MPDTALVALTRGDDRYSNVASALDLIADQIEVRGKERILIKPNFVMTDRPLAATHVDAVRAVLEFLRRRTSAMITIGESSAAADTMDGYRNYGYTDLAKDYNVKLVDFNRGEWVKAPVYDTSFKDMYLRVSKTVVESDLRISVSPPKTHDAVIITLSLKNMVMGSLIRDQREQGGAGPTVRAVRSVSGLLPSRVKNSKLMAPLRTGLMRNMVRSDKAAMHMGYGIMNLNLCRLAPLVYPHVSVLDGFVGMEGPGPTRGDPVDLRCAVASTDFLAADTVAAALMGYDIDEAGYLHYCKAKGLGVGDLARITVVGNTSVEESRHPFAPPPGIADQRNWRIRDAERFL